MLKHTLIFFSILFFIGCDEQNKTEDKHFQGTDCLKCHNTDLTEEHNLKVGLSIFYKENQEDKNCNSSLYLRFTDSNRTLISTDFENQDIRNNNGNIYILSRYLKNLSGNFNLSIVDDNNNTVLSSSFNHSFNNKDYTDDNNRYSCNYCHSESGYMSPLYVNKINCKE